MAASFIPHLTKLYRFVLICGDLDILGRPVDSGCLRLEAALPASVHRRAVSMARLIYLDLRRDQRGTLLDSGAASSAASGSNLAPMALSLQQTRTR